ncbi:MAG: hydrogenase iron-sulfur subunit [Dehalococcoidia bacterium]
MDNFEPKILAFCCNWCSYAGADLAGTSRMQYPSNVRIIRVMCSGRVNPFFILKALSLGADGVLVLGCHPGDCHYLTGNYRTRRRLAITMKLMEFMGIEPERIQVSWCSASEGSRFAEVVNGVTAEVKQIGPNRLFNE